jgi:molybdopterin-guanine dinucleotide biosynthesis protein A
MRHPASCGILAGGASSRMGKNKALLDFRGRPLLERQIEILSPLFDEVLIGANDAAPYARFGLRVVPDLLPERCSLTGIHALLRGARHERVFVVACDMPFLNPALIERLLETRDVEVAVPDAEGGLEPLHAVYGKACLGAIEEKARQGAWKVSDFYPLVRVERIRIRDAEWAVDGHSPFTNANTPDEWRRAEP